MFKDIFTRSKSLMDKHQKTKDIIHPVQKMVEDFFRVARDGLHKADLKKISKEQFYNFYKG